MHNPRHPVESTRSAGRVVLGLDPGSRRTGYGILCSEPDGIRRVASGVLRLDEQRPFAERLPQLRHKMVELIRTYRPDEAVLETCFVARSPRSALVLGHVRGVLLLLCLESGMQVFEYSPSEIKRAVTGSGAASKQQVQRMLPRILMHANASTVQDEADALATAFCHINKPEHARSRPLRSLP